VDNTVPEEHKDIYWHFILEEDTLFYNYLLHTIQFIPSTVDRLLYVHLDVDVVLCPLTRFWMWRSVFSLLYHTYLSECFVCAHFIFSISYIFWWFVRRPISKRIFEHSTFQYWNEFSASWFGHFTLSQSISSYWISGRAQEVPWQNLIPVSVCQLIFCLKF
jgi:hypothetical protein